MMTVDCCKKSCQTSQISHKSCNTHSRDWVTGRVFLSTFFTNWVWRKGGCSILLNCSVTSLIDGFAGKGLKLIVSGGLSLPIRFIAACSDDWGYLSKGLNSWLLDSKLGGYWCLFMQLRFRKTFYILSPCASEENYLMPAKNYWTLVCNTDSKYWHYTNLWFLYTRFLV